MFKCLIKTATAEVIAIDGTTVLAGKIGESMSHRFFENTLESEAAFADLKGESIWWEADIPVGTAIELEFVFRLVSEVVCKKMLLVCNNQALMDGLWDVLFAFGARDFIALRKGSQLKLETTSATPWHVRVAVAYQRAVRQLVSVVRLASA